jgi:hypothetical protein
LPSGTLLGFDLSDNLYISTGNQVFKVPPTGPTVTVADLSRLPSLSPPASLSAVAFDNNGTIYAAGLFVHEIYKSQPDGSFKVFVESVNQPTGFACDAKNNLYFIEGGTHVVKKVTPDGTVSKVLHGGELDDPNGACSSFPCYFTGPGALAVDPGGNVYVGALNGTLLQSSPSGEPAVLAGSTGGPGYVDGDASNARFGGYDYFAQQDYLAGPYAVAVDEAKTVYVADPANSAIRKITADKQVTTLATGFGKPQSFVSTRLPPINLAIDPATNLFVTHVTSISAISPAGVITLIAGSSNQTGNVDGRATRHALAGRIFLVIRPGLEQLRERRFGSCRPHRRVG